MSTAVTRTMRCTTAADWDGGCVDWPFQRAVHICLGVPRIMRHEKVLYLCTSVCSTAVCDRLRIGGHPWMFTIEWIANRLGSVLSRMCTRATVARQTIVDGECGCLYLVWRFKVIGARCFVLYRRETRGGFASHVVVCCARIYDDFYVLTAGWCAVYGG